MKYRNKNKMQGKLYSLFCRDLTTGVLYGYVEHSFSMGWCGDTVRVFDKIPLHSLNKQNRKDKKLHYFIARVGSKNCPSITLKGRYSRSWRNCPFKDDNKLT